MIETGQVVFVKTTSEPVFILKISDTVEGPFKNLVDVRRPQMTENGIQHTVDSFFMEELETLEDQRLRIRNEYKNSEFAKSADITEAKGQLLEIPTTESVN